MSQHALQELEQLTIETTKMEKEKRTLEFVLRDGRAGRDSIKYKLLLTVLYKAACINIILCCIKDGSVK